LNIAIIPARGQSKRLPRKNIRVFQGRPMITYAIDNAFRSGVFDQVIVSTDDIEIAEIAKHSGALVPWLRSRELSDDFASTVSVIQDAATRLEDDFEDIQNICCIYPTTPLLQPDSLSGGLKILESGNWEYVVSVTLAEAPPERFLTLGSNKEILFSKPEYEFTRTQDLRSSFRDAGQFYWGKKSSWLAGAPLFTSNSTVIELRREFSVDIDSIEDWRYAEALFELYKKGVQ